MGRGEGAAGQHNSEGKKDGKDGKKGKGKGKGKSKDVIEEKPLPFFEPELINSVIRAFGGGFCWSLPVVVTPPVDEFEGYAQDNEDGSITYELPLKRQPRLWKIGSGRAKNLDV